MAVSVAAKQLKAGSVALGSLWKVVATVTQRCVLHKGSAKWPYGDRIIEPTRKIWGCPGVPVHEGIPIVFITIHGVMTQFVNVSFFCVPVHEDTTKNLQSDSMLSYHAVYTASRKDLTDSLLRVLYCAFR